MKSEPRPTLSSLATAEEMSQALKGLVSPERLTELSLAGYFPCWRVDDGPPLYQRSEVRKYVEEHLLKRSRGAPFPVLFPVVEPVEKLGPMHVPARLRHMAHYLRSVPILGLSGIYFLAHNGEVVYVGQSVNVVARVHGHINEGLKDFDSAVFLPAPRRDLDSLECAFINALKPRHNKNTGRTNHGCDETELLVNVGFK
jgi:hypothetical protein